jgi:transposase-like protein
MRYPASEKAEIIQLVELSHLPAKRTLDKLGIPRATFYRWYDRYREAALRRWVTTVHDQIVSGTASRTMSAARSSTWR